MNNKGCYDDVPTSDARVTKLKRKILIFGLDQTWLVFFLLERFCWLDFRFVLGLSVGFVAIVILVGVVFVKEVVFEGVLEENPMGFAVSVCLGGFDGDGDDGFDGEDVGVTALTGKMTSIVLGCLSR